MKKLTLLVILLFLVSAPIMGQELTKYFAGVLYTGSYDRDLKVSHNANFRLAAEFKVSGFTFRNAYSSENKNMCQVWWSNSFGEDTEIRFGFMPRPTAILNRPNIVTAGAQFEPGGVNVIPGAAIGGLFTQKLSDMKVYGGVYYLPNEKIPEYNIGFSNSVAGVGYFFSERNMGVAGTLKFSGLTLTGYYESIKTTSCFAEVVLGDLGAPYVSVVYDRTNKTYDSEIGWTKEYSIYSNNVYVLVGFGYLPEAKVLNVYFWVHL